VFDKIETAFWTAVGVAVGVGVGILFGAWLIQQAYGVLL
jgi:divalent metal cation (Fe/Co/Zn/Cd) transporter